MELGDMVIARTGDGEQEGRIVGRTLESRAKYDVLTEKSGILVNVPENHIREISYATAKEPKQVG